MRLLDLTLPDAAANVALDEALLEAADAADEPGEVLRLWEPAAPLVVLGRSSHVAAEVHVDACRARNIPIVRRTSGGLSIVSGPGCLMYAVVLSYELRPHVRGIDDGHREVLRTLLAALRPFAPALTRDGSSDLVLDGRKVSGNSMRSKRRHFLYHGTLLYDFPLDLIGTCLAEPPRSPEYRAGRPHDGFVTNLPVAGTNMRRAIANAWQANEPLVDWPRELTQRLTEEKFSREDWTFRH
jgi:lipoate---protein ligase